MQLKRVEKELRLLEQDALGLKPSSVSSKNLVIADSRKFVTGQVVAVENNCNHPTVNTQYRSSRKQQERGKRVRE